MLRRKAAPHALAVMPALVAGIHALANSQQDKTWMAGTKPGHDEGRILTRSSPCKREPRKSWMADQVGHERKKETRLLEN